MARLKGEVLQHQYDRHGVPFKDRMVAQSPDLARKFSGLQAGIINALQALPGIRHIIMRSMGMDARRHLPSYAGRTLTQMHPELLSTNYSGEPDVVLLIDTYAECHETSNGQAAIRIFQVLGKKVMLLDAGCCQRPRISHGFLREASEKVKPAVDTVMPWLKKNIPVVVLEPGCASAWTDDIPDLLEDDNAASTLKGIQTFEKVLSRILEEDSAHTNNIKPRSNHILIHGHCHQKSIFGMSPVKKIFEKWPEVKVDEIDSGCCGMAGSFGYESKHYEISKKMAERVLVPAILSHPDALVIANGFSCRHQIKDFAGRKAIHIAEAFDIVD
jgi:Fe-S oxidoreductase